MRLILTVICLTVHAALSDVAHSQLLPQPAASAEIVPGGLAQGFIRYVDGEGAQRLVGYSYPEPLYSVHRLSYNNKQFLESPVLKTSVQPGYIEQEYILQGPSNNLLAREEHFRTWNLQRHQALKSEVDKLYAQGKIPAEDMLARLKQLEQLTTSIKATGISETPEVKQAREDHLRLWNEARLKVLQLEAEQTKTQGKQEASQLEPRFGGETVESAEQQKARQEHLRLYNEQLQRLQGQGVAEQPGTQLNRLIAPASQLYLTTAEIKPLEQSTAGIMETPEVQRAKEEHLRLWNEAKQRAEAEASKLSAIETKAPGIPHPDFPALPALKTTEITTPSVASIQQTKSSVLPIFGAEVQVAKISDSALAAQAAKTSESEQIFNEEEQLRAVQLRDMERLREEEKMREIERQREAERLKEEERQMEEERLRIKAEDEARLRSDLQEQFSSVIVPQAPQAPQAQVINPASIFLLGNQYNPYVLRYATPATYPVIGAPATQYSIPGGFVYRANVQRSEPSPILHEQNLQALPHDLKSLSPVKISESTPAQKSSHDDSKALSELDKATREHFRAHEKVLEQLRLANLKQATQEGCN